MKDLLANHHLNNSLTAPVRTESQPTDREPAQPEPSPSSRSHLNRTVDVAERVRLMRDGILNYLGTLISGVVSIVLIPVMLAGLGSELYGLWITALTVSGLLASVDLGLGWSITREVAAGLNGKDCGKTARFVVSAANFYLQLGIFGAFVITGLGFLIRGRLHLSPENQNLALLFLGLVGLAFVGDQLIVYALGVLQGMRRFGTASVLTVVATLLRAGGLILLLALDSGLIRLAGWNLITSVTMALAGLLLIGNLEPRYSFRVRWRCWGDVCPYFRFGITSQLTMLANNSIWQTAPFLIGLTRGSAAIVPYYVGQRLPLAASVVSWRVAETVFPAVSEQDAVNNGRGIRELLDVGTRWTVLFALPICALLWILSPDLLRIWVGIADPVTLFVLRLTAIAALADALGVTALHLLLASGAARSVLYLLGGLSATSILLTLCLVIYLGTAQAVWGLLVPMTFGALVLIYLASTRCGLGPLQVLRSVGSGLLVPSGVLVLVAVLAVQYFQPSSWLGIILIASVGGAIYVAVLYLNGARQEERAFLPSVSRLPVDGVCAAVRALRSF